MRSKLLSLVWTCSALSAFGVEYAGTTIVNLDAATLNGAAGGAVTSWTGAGALATFEAVNSGTPPTCQQRDGVPVVRFAGAANTLKSQFATPAGILKGGDYSIELWVCSAPPTASAVTMFATTARTGLSKNDGTCCEMRYGTTVNNAVEHYGTGYNLGFWGSPNGKAPSGWSYPPPGVWHHLVNTFDGRFACLYVDGRLVARRYLTTLNISSEQAFCTIGAVWDRSAKKYDLGYTGDIAKIRVHDGCLTADQVYANFVEENASTFHLDPTTLQPCSVDGAWVGSAFTDNQALTVLGTQPTVLDGVTGSLVNLSLNNSSLVVKNGALTLQDTVHDILACGNGVGQTAQLTVGEGGTLSIPKSTSLSMGFQSGKGLLTIQAGGRVNCADWLRLGDFGGRGELYLEAGGTVDCTILSLAGNCGDGEATIAGTLTAPTIYLGESGGTGTLNVEPGAQVTATTIRPYNTTSGTTARMNLNGGTLTLSGTVSDLASCTVTGAATIAVPTNAVGRIASPLTMTAGETAPTIQKAGEGMLVVSDTVTGPAAFVVAEGTLVLAHPLAEGQTVQMADGAQFYVVSPDDLGKVTWASPTAARSVYAILADRAEPLDLVGFNSLYFDMQLAGPLAGTATLAAPVTYGAVSPANPFVVTTITGTTLSLKNTNLENLPLRVAGAGTTAFQNERRVALEDGSETLAVAPTATASFTALTIAGAGDTAATLALTGGTVKVTGTAQIGFEGNAGALTAENTKLVFGSLNLGPGTADHRAMTPATVALGTNTTLETGAISFAPYSLTDGTRRGELLSSLTLGAGSTLKVTNIAKNDDPGAEIVFDGGLLVESGSGTTLFAPYQLGSFDVRATAGHDIRLDFPANVNTLLHSGTTATTTFSGLGGLVRTGAGSLNLSQPAVASFTYAGDTRFEAGANTFTTAFAFPTGADKGVVHSAYAATLNLNGQTVAFNNIYDNGALGNSAAADATVVVGRGDTDVTLGFAPQNNIKLRKEGTGTLTVNGALGGEVELAGAAVCQVPTFRHYRFVVLRACGPKCNSMEFSELKLLDGDTDVTGLRSGFKNTEVSDSSPNAERPANALDGNGGTGQKGTKYLDFRCSATAAAANRGMVRLQIDYAEPQRVTAYNWATSDMTVGRDDSRDPADWLLQGSNDEATWTTLDVRKNFTAPAARWTWAGPFAVPSGAKAVNVGGAPGSTLTVDGVVQPLANASMESLTVTNGGALSLSEGQVFAHLMGDGVVRKTGNGTVKLVGTPHLTGETQVVGGRLALDAFKGWKWFRMTFKKTEGNVIMETSEFALYDANGQRVNKGLLQMSDGTAAANLQPNSFAQAKGYAHGNGETVDKLFDDDTKTKWCVTSPALNAPDNSANWVVVTLRLAENAAPVAGYLLKTTIHASDFWLRNPNTWQLEASDDGIAWVTVDTRANLSTPHTVETAFNGGTPYPVNCPTVPSDDATPGSLGTVSVAAEATLAVPAVVSASVAGLKVDWNDCGTITRLVPAADGVLDLVNVPDESGSNFVVPLVVESVAGSFQGWKVRINGTDRKGLGITYQGARLHVSETSTLIILR